MHFAESLLRLKKLTNKTEMKKTKFVLEKVLRVVYQKSHQSINQYGLSVKQPPVFMMAYYSCIQRITT